MGFNKALFLLLFLAACGGREEFTKTDKQYFDIRGYFEEEAINNQQKKLFIEKTVAQNNQSEKKQVTITDWKTELELFSESDINKPAWRNSYQVSHTDTLTKYFSTDDKLRTREIHIVTFANGTVKQISIMNKTSNFLYSSTEELKYIPGSLYSIKKQQHVFILGGNSYSVFGRIKN